MEGRHRASSQGTQKLEVHGPPCGQEIKPQLLDGQKQEGSEILSPATSEKPYLGKDELHWDQHLAHWNLFLIFF